MKGDPKLLKRLNDLLADQVHGAPTRNLLKQIARDEDEHID